MVINRPTLWPGHLIISAHLSSPAPILLPVELKLMFVPWTWADLCILSLHTVCPCCAISLPSLPFTTTYLFDWCNEEVVGCDPWNLWSWASGLDIQPYKYWRLDVYCGLSVGWVSYSQKSSQDGSAKGHMCPSALSLHWRIFCTIWQSNPQENNSISHMAFLSAESAKGHQLSLSLVSSPARYFHFLSEVLSRYGLELWLVCHGAVVSINLLHAIWYRSLILK
jgi:hypothetical protein